MGTTQLQLFEPPAVSPRIIQTHHGERTDLATVQAQIVDTQPNGREIDLVAQADLVVLALLTVFAVLAAHRQPLKMRLDFALNAASTLLPEKRSRRFGGADVHPPAIPLGATCGKGELFEGRAQHRRPVRLYADITQLGQARP